MLCTLTYGRNCYGPWQMQIKNSIINLFFKKIFEILLLCIKREHWSLFLTNSVLGYKYRNAKYSVSILLVVQNAHFSVGFNSPLDICACKWIAAGNLTCIWFSEVIGILVLCSSIHILLLVYVHVYVQVAQNLTT